MRCVECGNMCLLLLFKGIFSDRALFLGVDVKFEPFAKLHQALCHFIDHVEGEIGPHYFGVVILVIVVIL